MSGMHISRVTNVVRNIQDPKTESNMEKTGDWEWEKMANRSGGIKKTKLKKIYLRNFAIYNLLLVKTPKYHIDSSKSPS